jgi:hypothetical protein
LIENGRFEELEGVFKLFKRIGADYKDIAQDKVKKRGKQVNLRENEEGTENASIDRYASWSVM